MNLLDASDGFAAMGSDARLTILRVLVKAGEGGLLVGDIQKRTDIAPSTLAHHLKHLSAAGLILQEKQGRQIMNQANYEHLKNLASFILEECCAESGD